MLSIVKHTGRLWLWIAIAVILIAGHGVILFYISSHIAVSAAVIAGVILLVLVKHLGLLGPLYAMLRKRRRRP